MHILNINMRMYITSAHAHKLSGVFVQIRKILYLFFHRIIMFPGPGSVLCMIRERHEILKTVLHSRLAV